MKTAFPEDLRDRVELEQIGARIRHFREQRQMTKTDLGRLIGVSHVHVLRIEEGVCNLQIARLRVIARALGVALWDLLEQEPQTAQTGAPAPRVTRHTPLPPDAAGLREEILERIARQYGERLFAGAV